MCVLFLPWWASNEQNKGTNGTVDRQPAGRRALRYTRRSTAERIFSPSEFYSSTSPYTVGDISPSSLYLYSLFSYSSSSFKKDRLIPLSYCVPTNPYSSSTVQFQRNITHESSIQISTKQKMRFSSYLASRPAALNDENRRKTIFSLHCQPTSLKLMPSCSFQVLFLTSPTYLINYLDSTKTNWTFLLQVFIINIVVLLRIANAPWLLNNHFWAEPQNRARESTPGSKDKKPKRSPGKKRISSTKKRKTKKKKGSDPFSQLFPLVWYSLSPLVVLAQG